MDMIDKSSAKTKRTKYVKRGIKIELGVDRKSYSRKTRDTNYMSD